MLLNAFETTEVAKREYKMKETTDVLLEWLLSILVLGVGATDVTSKKFKSLFRLLWSLISFMGAWIDGKRPWKQERTP